ncbi:peptidoglycan amidohydrolase family protein [Leuconostocaceae bacterium ESL0958]|nr:peptidoglycan amidohydrolase family protein [Leuconostocaceae bacterium ESL0958]
MTAKQTMWTAGATTLAATGAVFGAAMMNPAHQAAADTQKSEQLTADHWQANSVEQIEQAIAKQGKRDDVNGYVPQWGDTLTGIAAAYRLAPDDLANRLGLQDQDLLLVGYQMQEQAKVIANLHQAGYLTGAAAVQTLPTQPQSQATQTAGQAQSAQRPDLLMVQQGIPTTTETPSSEATQAVNGQVGSATASQSVAQQASQAAASSQAASLAASQSAAMQRQQSLATAQQSAASQANSQASQSTTAETASQASQSATAVAGAQAASQVSQSATAVTGSQVNSQSATASAQAGSQSAVSQAPAGQSQAAEQTSATNDSQAASQTALQPSQAASQSGTPASAVNQGSQAAAQPVATSAAPSQSNQSQLTDLTAQQDQSAQVTPTADSAVSQPASQQGVDTEKVLSWFYHHQGQLTYSMSGSRNGDDGTADCSGAMTQALYEAGASKPAYLYNTDSLHGYLQQNGYHLIAENQPWQAQRGDIVIWGTQGNSAGSAGHVQIMTSPDRAFSVNYAHGDQVGAASSEWNYQNAYNVTSQQTNGHLDYYVYRQ